MAAKGYPEAPETGGALDPGDAEAQGARVFHAGTMRDEDGTLRASGGRVLSVAALGADVKSAQAAAYAAVERVDFPGGYCRRDIGWREVARAGALSSRAEPPIG